MFERKRLKLKMSEIVKKLRKKKSVIVAFSGGVDSSVVAALAHKALGEKALAVTVDSPLLPPNELKEAEKTARQVGIRHRVIKMNELTIPGFAVNPNNRCYLCKKYRLNAIKKLAEKNKFKVIVDGATLSDLSEYRPGLKASREMGVYSPLLEAGLMKRDVRIIAGFLGLPTANKPSSPCLASRVPYGERLTLERLSRIAAAESYIKKLTGVKSLRVRDHNGLARIEVGRSERRLFDENSMDKIAEKLKKLGYRFVALDLEGYRPGSFDETGKQR